MSFRLGRLLGIPVDVDLSWIVIFALFAYSIGVGYFSKFFPGLATGANLFLGMIAAALFFATLLAHELAHSYVARKSGIPIAGITLFIFGGVARMKAEPGTPADEFRMAIAGPVTSFAAAAAFGILGGFAGRGTVIGAVLLYVALANLLVAGFNLLPGFPLDGGRVLRALLWHVTGNLRRATRISSWTGQALGWMMIIGGVTEFVFGNTLGGVWLVLLGWFLNTAAQTAYQQLLMRRALEGLTVVDVMTPGVEAVSPDTTVEDLVQNHFLRTHADAYPVLRGDSFLGIVRLEEVRGVPRADWPRVQVARIARPVEDSFVARVDEPAWDVLGRMAEMAHGTVFVLDGNRLAGSVRQEYLATLLKLRMGAEERPGSVGSN